ncbi:uncharacterized protein C4orf51 homolog [Erethizon dorsatum]
MSQFLFLTPQILLPFSPLTSQEFDLFRHKARASWQNETRWSDSSMTTYSGSYQEKQLDESTRGQITFRTAGQHKPGCKRTLLLNSSTHSPLLSGASTQETKDVKDIVNNAAVNERGSEEEVGLLHGILHGWRSQHPGQGSTPTRCPIIADQWATLVPSTVYKERLSLWDHGSREARGQISPTPIATLTLLLHPALGIRHPLLPRFQGQRDSVSKVGSSEDSEADQFSDYGRGGLLSLLF